MKNQYRGINAHLHSFWQGAGRWNRFHNVHVSHLMMALKARLLPMGYTAEIEESIQIRRIGEAPSRPRADILISDLDPRRAQQLSAAGISNAQTVPIDALIETEEDREYPYSAVAIYEQSSDLEEGESVAWIELLPPSNKGHHRDAYVYQGKRWELPRTGMVFVELDYLHETPPTFPRLPDYTQHPAVAHPYRIVVLDPRPDVRRAYLYELDVDMPIPVVKIPLSGTDVLDFDFGTAYHRTFEDGLYGYSVDYGELPVNFDRYGPADQGRIAARMLAVLEAARAGLDLETGPFPVKTMPLEDALAQIKAVMSQA